MDIKSIEEAIHQFGTPAYFFDGGKIEEKYHCLKESMPDNFEIFYSIKANPSLGICQLMHKLGSNAEVASAGELYIALEAGFKPEEIIFTSPGKTVEELEYAINLGIHCINIESVREAQIIQSIASKKSKKVDILIRINPDFDVSGASIKMTGVPTQFGIDVAQLKEAFESLSDLPNVKIAGIHIYTGTQALHTPNICANMEEVVKLALRLSETYGFELKLLDLGGGFGIAYFDNEKDLDVSELKAGIEEVWSKYGQSLKNTRVIIESGRFLTAEAGAYLTRVLYVKHNKGRKYAICDGGSNHHANSAFLGRHVRSNFPMHILGKHGEEEEVNIVGPLCTPTDVIGQRVKLPEVKEGDIVVVEKSGAYGLSNSPAMFLSHQIPAEILYYKGRLELLRRRGRVEETLINQEKITL